MTKKDYIAVAAALAKVTEAEVDSRGWRATVADALARVFAADNIAFDRARFLTACGCGK